MFNSAVQICEQGLSSYWNISLGFLSSRKLKGTGLEQRHISCKGDSCRYVISVLSGIGNIGRRRIFVIFQTLSIFEYRSDGSVVLERLHYNRKVAGSSPGRVIPKTLKMVLGVGTLSTRSYQWTSLRCSLHCIRRRVA